MSPKEIETLETLSKFPLLQALAGRRSRRFCVGASIPDGPFIMMYVRAQHIDLEFYNHYFKPGAYLETHKEHMKRWH